MIYQIFFRNHQISSFLIIKLLDKFCVSLIEIFGPLDIVIAQINFLIVLLITKLILVSIFILLLLLIIVLVLMLLLLLNSTRAWVRQSTGWRHWILHLWLFDHSFLSFIEIIMPCRPWLNLFVSLLPTCVLRDLRLEGRLLLLYTILLSRKIWLSRPVRTPLVLLRKRLPVLIGVQIVHSWTCGVLNNLSTTWSLVLHVVASGFHSVVLVSVTKIIIFMELISLVLLLILLLLSVLLAHCSKL